MDMFSLCIFYGCRRLAYKTNTPDENLPEIHLSFTSGHTAWEEGWDFSLSADCFAFL